MQTMRRPITISAFRRALSSPEAAVPQEHRRLLQQAGGNSRCKSKSVVARQAKRMTRSRSTTSSHRTASEGRVFNQFVGPPYPAPPRLSLLMLGGGLNAWHATVVSAKREAHSAGQSE